MYLKWVGSKNQIINDIVSQFPKDIDRYIEPFIGSASVYFGVHDSTQNNLYFKEPSSFYLSDTNFFLINCHSEVRDNSDKVCNKLNRLEKEHNEAACKKSLYLEIRSKVTNASIASIDPSELAAYFIYINKTCFNGLWRVNKSGKNNVPFNNNKTVSFNYELIKEASKKLSKADLIVREFDDIDEEELGPGTFVYLDPPYVPLNPTSSFTSYTSKGFNINDLDRLKKLCEKLDANNAKWMLSNSTAPFVYETFNKWNISEIMVHRFVRAIKNKDEKREKVAEVIVRNY